MKARSSGWSLQNLGQGIVFGAGKTASEIFLGRGVEYFNFSCRVGENHGQVDGVDDAFVQFLDFGSDDWLCAATWFFNSSSEFFISSR